MLGLMQDWPLTVDKILDHAKSWHGDTEIDFPRGPDHQSQRCMDAGILHRTEPLDRPPIL